MKLFLTAFCWSFFISTLLDASWSYNWKWAMLSAGGFILYSLGRSDGRPS